MTGVWMAYRRIGGLALNRLTPASSVSSTISSRIGGLGAVEWRVQGLAGAGAEDRHRCE